MNSNKTNLCFICAVLHLLILQISASVQNDVLYVILYLFAYALPSFILWKTVKESQVTQNKPIALTHIFAFFPIMVIASSIAVLTFGSVSAGNYEVNTSTFLLAGLAAPICEEIFWRGYIQKNLSQRWNPNWGFIVTTLVYSLVHLSKFNFMLIMAAAVAGFIWGLAYRFFPERLGAIIISHALWDCAVFIWFPIG